jgi:hypothetical protein
MKWSSLVAKSIIRTRSRKRREKLLFEIISLAFVLLDPICQLRMKNTASFCIWKIIFSLSLKRWNKQKRLF